MVLTVNFTWKDLRTGRILLERKNFQQTATFYPTLREGEFIGSQEAVEKLDHVRDINLDFPGAEYRQKLAHKWFRISKLHEMGRRGARYGLATMCIGVGQGIASIWERV